MKIQSPVISSLLMAQDKIQYVKIINTQNITKLKEILQGALDNNQEISDEWLIQQTDWHNQCLYSQIIPLFGQQQLSDVIFIISALNFCFWKMDGSPHASFYNEQEYTGYWSLLASLLSAKQENVDFTDYEYLSCESFNLDILTKYFGKDCPLLKLRLIILKDIAQIIIKQYNCTIQTLLKKNQMDCSLILSELVQNFPCFNDRYPINNMNHSINYSSTYNEEDVIQLYQKMKKQQQVNNDQYLLFYKRAQIFLAELHYSQAVKLQNISIITAFADYRIPQILHYLGYLQYDEELTQILKNNILLYPGCKIECCIRASTILCVNQIKEEIQKQTQIIISDIFIDFMLWNYFKVLQKERGESHFDIPMHRVISWNY